MNVDQSQQFIVGSMTATAIFVAGEALAEGHRPPARAVVGFGGACIGLGVISLWSPDLAAGLAGLVLVSTILVNSDTLWSAIIKTTGAPATTTKPKVMSV